MDDSSRDATTALYGAIVVNLMRIYDVQMMLLVEQNPTGAQQLRELHKQGKFFAPPPAIWIGPDDDNSVDSTEPNSNSE